LRSVRFALLTLITSRSSGAMEMLSGPVGRSGEEAEDETACERDGLGVRGSRSLFAAFFMRAIANGGEEMRYELRRRRDVHKRRISEMSHWQCRERVNSCQIPFLGQTDKLQLCTDYERRPYEDVLAKMKPGCR